MDFDRFVHLVRDSRLFILLSRNRREIAWLLGCMLLFFVNKAILCRWNIPLLRNHFNDLLAMPAMLAYSNLVLGFFKKKAVHQMKPILFLTFGCAFMWEIAAIWIKPDSTCDILDVFCYVTGAVIYQLSQRDRREKC